MCLINIVSNALLNSLFSLTDSAESGFIWLGSVRKALGKHSESILLVSISDHAYRLVKGMPLFNLYK